MSDGPPSTDRIHLGYVSANPEDPWVIGLGKFDTDAFENPHDLGMFIVCPLRAVVAEWHAVLGGLQFLAYRLQ